MDGSHFDTLTRALVEARSRRGLAWLLGGLVLGGSLAPLALDASAAKKKGSSKKRKKRRHPSVSPPPVPSPPLNCGTGQQPCDGRCIPESQCCADADCPNPSLPRCCGGTCVAATQCCRDAHCFQGRTCQGGTCHCPADKPAFCDGACQECCAVTDCRPASFADGQECQNGQCVCTWDGTRRCPQHEGVCGYCCEDSECPPGTGQECSPPHGSAYACNCGLFACGDVCMHQECYEMCEQQCETVGAVCCQVPGTLRPDLVCQRVGSTLKLCLPPA